MSTRNIPTYRDATIILIDQLKDVHVLGELEVIDTRMMLDQKSQLRVMAAGCGSRKARISL